MKQIRLLTLLALLLTAATGAWAQEPTTYSAKMKDGTVDAKNWSIASGEKSAKGDAADGLTGLSEKDAVTLQYNGRLKVKGVKATSDAAATGNIVDLSTLTADYEAQNGDVLTNATTTYKVTIAAGATVTLDGVSISSSGGYYCIKCLGDATIILKDGSTNTLTSTSTEYPALSIGDANTTLTIQGSTGVLNVTSGEYCAGIGGGYMNANKTCGNIRIEGGVITAQGGPSGAGIGTDCGEATCGEIIITGGTITAKGGGKAAGIGTGKGESVQAVCGDITIANTVTKVTATKGENAAHSIGKGFGDKASCGTVTIGGTKYWENNAAVNGGDTYLAQATIEYPAPAAVSLIVDPVVGQIIGSDGKNYDANATLPTGVTAVAKICYVGSDAETSTTYNHGLALALSDVSSSAYSWCSQTSSTCLTTQYSSSSAAKADMAGLANTDALVGHGSHTHYAARAARNYNSGTHPTGTSAWFLPSAGQWDKMATAAGGYGTLRTNAGLQWDYYWSSSERNAGSAWYFYPDGDWGYGNKGFGYLVRACLAF